MVGPTEEEIWNNIKDLTPDEILILCCKMGYMKGVIKSIEMCADINTPSAMVKSIYYNNYDITKYLLENGAQEEYCGLLLKLYQKNHIYPSFLLKILDKYKDTTFVDENGNIIDEPESELTDILL